MRASELPARLCASMPIVVAIPVCNEEEHILACLDALDRQIGIARDAFAILLFLNNCTDATRRIVEENRERLGPSVHIVEVMNPDASAGWARRQAMEAALALLGSEGERDGVILTSDADSRVAPDWISTNLAALEAGADLVAGRLTLDPADQACLPPHIQARGRDEAMYEALLAEISTLVDPQHGNPWPNHWTKSGATIAVRAQTYRAVGGMPDIPSGEDHTFVDRIKRQGHVVRHAPEVEVVTSGRLIGRATGGVAGTLRQRCDDLEAHCDDRLEPVARFLFRTLAARHLERAPLLPFRPLRPSQLPMQIRRARLALRLLRGLSALPAGRRAGRLPVLPETPGLQSRPTPQ